MTDHQSISFSRLVQSKANVRRTGQIAGIDALMASIVRQNLNVREAPDGRFEVIAGERRLIALKKLARAGAIPADLPVLCWVLVEGENATEISKPCTRTTSARPLPASSHRACPLRTWRRGSA